MIKSIFNWSGGKDSSLALYKILQSNTHEVQTLVTTLSEEFDRISMHGVRSQLLKSQAEAIGIPLTEIRLPEMPSMSSYDNIMKEVMGNFKQEGITTSIFGDIFLEDLKIYREKQLATVGMKAHFPLWKGDTTDLLNEFIDLGFKTILVCVNADLLPEEFAGRVIDKDFIKDLPTGVDPCGENGEFHTFVFDGPIFKKPVEFELGELVFKAYKAPKDPDDNCFKKEDAPKLSGFYFRDLIPK